jgi:hypothetical protein
MTTNRSTSNQRRLMRLGVYVGLPVAVLVVTAMTARAYDTTWIVSKQPISATKLKADLDEAQTRLLSLETGNQTITGAKTFSQDALFNGKIGIGMSSGSAKLAIAGSAGTTTAIFGDTLPVAMVADWPTVAFNAYFESGWKGITANKPTSALGMHVGTGAFVYSAGTTPAAGGDPVTMTSIFAVGPGGDMWSVGSGDSGPRLNLQNMSKTADNIAQTWTIANMTGGNSNSLQFWATDARGCGTGLCAYRMALYDNGNVAITGTLSQGSSAALKKDIRYLDDDGLENALALVKQTPVASYRYKSAAPASRPVIGVIAERTPKALLGDDDKSVNLSSTVGVLLAAVKAQQAHIDALQARLARLEGRRVASPRK